jgi:DNA mismatch repair protein MutL
MSKIRILPEHLANQIAAGEVVERPASVVKELLENCLDAGADRVEIEIEGGGTRLIRVVDNGEGMDEDDVLLCLERHGTSKLFEPGQLSEIITLGFRGEAIPSIAAVSKLTIISRPRDSDLGTMVVSHFGTIKSVRESGARSGTSVEIANLFGNTPARRKFLRTARTEIAHIDEVVRSCALARPDVFFSLLIDGRQTLRLDHEQTLERRLAQLLNYHDELITIDSGPPGPDAIAVRGLLIPPEACAPVGGRLRLLVNGRIIRDRLLTHAVGEGLRSFLLKGRFPAGVITVTLPPTEVDVNVHPAKHEVRFRDSRVVHHLVSQAVRDGMLKRQQHLHRELFQPPAEPYQPIQPMVTSAARRDTAPPSAVSANRPAALSWPAAPPATAAPEMPSTRENDPSTAYAPPPLAAPSANGAEEGIRVEELLVIGSFRDLYIFCRNRDRLVVIDQHAAHERLLFEELRRQYAGGRVASQQLLFPVTVELSAQQSQLVEASLETLTHMGFSLRDFGGTTWVIAAVPALAGSAHPQHLLFDILASLGGDIQGGNDSAIDVILATMACKAAVKAGDHLDDREIEALLKRIAAADLFSHCPHGRPVVKIFRESDLKKWFSRT